MNIDEVLQREEGQTFDRKSINISPKALAVLAVAFANADGGTIAIGITDKNRRIEGVDFETKKLNDLLRVPYDYCVPTLQVSTQFVECVDMEGRENHVLLLHVESGMDVYTNQADEAFMRVGDSSKKLSFMERTQLMYDKGGRYFEDRPVNDAVMDDLDLEFVRSYTQKIGYSKAPLNYLYENRGFIKDVDGIPRISTAAILLFGKYPQTYFPRARVRFIKYEGTEERFGTHMNVIKDICFEGNILTIIEKTVDFLYTQIREWTYLGEDGLFVTEEEYPRFVLQEVVVNAVTHRDYSITGTDIHIKMFEDKLVVESPGRLPGLVKTGNMRQTHFSRNPKIAEFLKAYKYVKEYGEGVNRMFEEMEKAGLPEPEYYKNDFMLQVIIRNGRTDKNNKITGDYTNYAKSSVLRETSVAYKAGRGEQSSKSWRGIKPGEEPGFERIIILPPTE